MLNLDPDLAAEQLSERTRVNLPVDEAGHPADLEALGALARKRGLVMIDDALHALGAQQGSRCTASRISAAFASTR